MKSLIALSSLLLATQAFSAEQVTCHAEKFLTSGSTGKADARISFELNVEEKTISKVIGHIFVQSTFSDDEVINVEEAYMAFFQIDSLSASENYKPLKYKGFSQFKDFDAAHTTGLEEGMWGQFVVDLKSTSKKFDARYIFQAGDHIGGTVLFTCRR